MSKTLIILNPTAGMKSAEAKIPLIRTLLEKYKIPYELVLTERPGHAIEIAEKTEFKDFSIVVAAGGDGTCHEVINGLMRAKKAGRTIPALAALSIGRGNDFQYGAGFSPELEEGIKVIKDGKRKKIDVGWLVGGLYPQGRFFGNGVGIGFSTIVGFEAAKWKFIHGPITYVFGALKTLFLYYRAPKFRIQLDDTVFEQKTLETSVMIGPRFGGGFYMAPDAIDDDGLFDVSIAGEAPRLQMLKLIGKYKTGTQKGSKYVDFRQARKVVITALEGYLVVHADGETICERGDKMEIECLLQQLEVIVSAASAS
jgi:YegS/Rv2252/BmrU family lipid kinase